MNSTKKAALFTAMAVSLSLCTLSCNKAISPEEQQKQKIDKVIWHFKVINEGRHVYFKLVSLIDFQSLIGYSSSDFYINIPPR